MKKHHFSVAPHRDLLGLFATWSNGPVFSGVFLSRYQGILVGFHQSWNMLKYVEYIYNIYIYIYMHIGSMYGIYANIWGILMVNVTIYTIHGSYGIYIYVSGNIIGIYQVVITCYNCDNSCKSGWWFQPTPLKNDGVKVSWDYSSHIWGLF